MEAGNDYGEVENPANHPIVIPIFFRFNRVLLHITDVSKEAWAEFGDLNGVSVDVIDPILAAVGFDTNTLSYTYEHQLSKEEIAAGFSIVRRTFEESIPTIQRIVVEEVGGDVEA